MRKSPLKRKTSLKRSSSIRKAKPATKAKQAVQRSEVRKRSDGACEFETEWFFGTYRGWEWLRCAKPAVDLAHIIPRRECGKARDLAAVVIHACRNHHVLYDASISKGLKPRVPPALLAGCRRAIKAAAMKAPLKRSIRERLT